MLASRPLDLSCIARIARVAKLFGITSLTILIIPIVLPQVKAGNTSENLLNEFRQIIYYCIDQKKLLKRYTII